MKTTAALLVLLLSACGGSNPPPKPPSNQNQEAPSGGSATPAATTPPEVTVSMAAGTGLQPGTGTVSASLSDTAGEGVIGATLVASSPALQGSQTAITDESGRADIQYLPAGKYLITVYYTDLTFETPVDVVDGKVTQLRIAKWNLKSADSEIIEIRAGP